MKYTYFKNNQYEIMTSKKGYYIKNIEKKIYYFKSDLNLSNEFYDTFFKENIKWNLFDSLLLLFTTFSIISFIFIILNINKIFVKPDATLFNILNTLFFLIINVLIHELAHFFVLKIYHREPGKINLKFKFIFPIIFVDSSDSYILPIYRRFFVYYSGIMINQIVCAIFILLSPNNAFIIQSVFLLIIFNLMPIRFIQTDGFHIFRLLLQKESYKT